MQTMISRWFGGDRPVLDDAARTRREVRLGIVGVLAVVLGVVAAGVLYAVPLGKSTYTAELTEAQSVKVGDDVRLAGVTVGAVTSLELQPDRVVMRFTVDDDVFVGDQTSLDIRMLTLVGGHYVALFPAGTEPLGDGVIPADRVRLPYSLMETFQDATAPLREVNGDTLRRNLAELDRAVTDAPETLRTTLDTVGSYVDAIDRQRAQVSNAIAVADEYVTMYDGAKSDLRRLMENVILLEDVLIDKRAELREAVALLTSVVQRVAALAPAWESSVRPRANQLSAAIGRLTEMGGTLEPVIATTRELGEKLRTLVIPEEGLVIDQSAQTVPAPAGLELPDVCVPVPGRQC
ncbi:MlaD family protein [Nocardia farcinica]|uniref:MlaD family protein n=1 Tax=Nocardia farcinica TaxID=37329 RepID=UPI0018950A11|nr:MlaD family protein [Nocardia farcinica]MBF6231348.1 MCE family protein [Nocardia farcinica]